MSKISKYCVAAAILFPVLAFAGGGGTAVAGGLMELNERK